MRLPSKLRAFLCVLFFVGGVQQMKWIFCVLFHRALLALKDEPVKVEQSPLNSTQLDLTEKLGDANGISISGSSIDRIKSAISIVQEIAQKRNLPIRFMVENETGPAHMKHFVIKCSVGEIEVRVPTRAIL